MGACQFGHGAGGFTIKFIHSSLLRQGTYCRVHWGGAWGGGDKRTIARVLSGDRRGDIKFLNPGGWLLLRDIEQQKPAKSEGESENEIEPESDAVFLKHVHHDGNTDWLINEIGNISDVDSLFYDTDDQPFFSSCCLLGCSAEFVAEPTDESPKRRPISCSRCGETNCAGAVSGERCDETKTKHFQG